MTIRMDWVIIFAIIAVALKTAIDVSECRDAGGDPSVVLVWVNCNEE